MLIEFLTKNFSFLKSIIEPVIIILAGLIIGRILGKIVKKILFEFRFKSDLKIHRIGESLVRNFVLIIAIILLIKNLNIGNIVLNIISVLGLFLIILFISLNSIEFILNSLSYRKIKNKFKEGDKIRIGKIRGVIEKIDVTKIKISSEDNIVIVPNFFLKNNHPK